LTTPGVVVIVVHGTDRNADDYYDYALKSRPAGSLVISPRFMTADDGPASHRLIWTNSGWKDGSNALTHSQLSSYAVMDELVAALGPRTRIEFIGHSAGGQFLHRYAAASTCAPTVCEFNVANPSSYLYLGPERPVGTTGTYAVPSTSCLYNEYKYGLDDLDDVPYMAAIGADILRARHQAANITYLLGERDTERDSNLDKECPAELQGRNRLARGRAFFAAPSTANPTDVLVTVPRVGHSASKMIGSTQARAALAD
jgi:hypothetical protein